MNLRSFGRFALGGMALILSACGSDAVTSETPSESLEVTARDFSFEPNSWTVLADTEFDVTMINEGFNLHEWTVLPVGERITTEAEFDIDDIALNLDDVGAGESVTRTFMLDAPGTYQVICKINGHFDAGMEGELTVVE